MWTQEAGISGTIRKVSITLDWRVKKKLTLVTREKKITFQLSPAPNHNNNHKEVQKKKVATSELIADDKKKHEALRMVKINYRCIEDNSTSAPIFFMNVKIITAISSTTSIFVPVASTQETQAWQTNTAARHFKQNRRLI